MGRAPGPRAARRCGPRHRRARLGHPRRHRLRRGGGAAVPRGPHQVALRRAHLHPAAPGGPRGGGASEVQPAAGAAERQARGGRGRLDRARHDDRADRRDAATRRAPPRSTSASTRRRCATRATWASTPGAVASSSPRRTRPTRSAAPSAPTRSATCRRRACSRPSAADASAHCTACFDGNYPTDVPARARQARARSAAEPDGAHVPRGRRRRRRGGARRRAHRRGGGVDAHARRSSAASAASAASSASTRPPIPTRSSSAAPMGSARSSRSRSALGRHDTIGIDLVNACLNDIAVSGADPLFFLDYLGIGDLRADVVEEIVGGVAAGCAAAGIPLVGGETAQMPDLYRGRRLRPRRASSVGVVARADLIDGSRRARRRRRCIGLPSSGPPHQRLHRWRAGSCPSRPGREPMPDGERDHRRRAARAASVVPRRRAPPAPTAARPRAATSVRWPTSPVAAGRATCRAPCPDGLGRRGRHRLLAGAADLHPHPAARRHRRRGDGPHLQPRHRHDRGRRRPTRSRRRSPRCPTRAASAGSSRCRRGRRASASHEAWRPRLGRVARTSRRSSTPAWTSSLVITQPAGRPRARGRSGARSSEPRPAPAPIRRRRWPVMPRSAAP